jgi:outer membrane lipase/esterase
MCDFPKQRSGGLVMTLFLRAFSCFAFLTATAIPTFASPLYSDVFFFGDSLTDSGNNALALAPGVTPVPIADNSFVPTFPYASGTYSDGPVWAQSFAASLGLSAAPLLAGGTNHAFGGARTGPLSPVPLPAGLLNPFPPSLETQAAYFLSQHANVAPSDALYVLAGGGDNARDGLEDIVACGLDPLCVGGAIASTASGYASDMAGLVGDLRTAGAERLIVWNVPALGAAPAVADAGGTTLANLLASSMNAALLAAIGGTPGVTIFDVFDLVSDVVSDPGAFGLTNVSDACAQFTACDPSSFLFWDGIHPTSAGHAIISDAMLALASVPEPATLALLLLGLAFLARRRSAR